MASSEIKGIRIAAVIRRDQDDALDRLVLGEGRSKSWIIREGLDLYFKKAGIKAKGQ